MYLSIDFEDFAHDLKRDLGLWETGPLRLDALWQSYLTIDAFLARHGGPDGRRATFFCTGVIADQAPDLIARIAGDGHEIACHYHFHDEMDRQDLPTVTRMLARARDALEAASGQPVRGFRAPKFRIDRSAPDQYRAVAAIFGYDSSFPTGDLAELTAFRRAAGLDDFPILPIFAGRFRGRGPALRLGGTYLKLFPQAVAHDLVAQARGAGFAPHIYLHPYEFAADGRYTLSATERRPLGWRKAAYWGLRQAQWNRIGNDGLSGKLAALIGAGGLAGRLDRDLAAASGAVPDAVSGTLSGAP